MHNIIKDYYNINLFDNNDLDNFVKVGWITEEQKAEIIASKTTQEKSNNLID